MTDAIMTEEATAQPTAAENLETAQIGFADLLTLVMETADAELARQSALRVSLLDGSSDDPAPRQQGMAAAALVTDATLLLPILADAYLAAGDEVEAVAQEVVKQASDRYEEAQARWRGNEAKETDLNEARLARKAAKDQLVPARAERDKLAKAAAAIRTPTITEMPWTDLLETLENGGVDLEDLGTLALFTSLRLHKLRLVDRLAYLAPRDDEAVVVTAQLLPSGPSGMISFVKTVNLFIGGAGTTGHTTQSERRVYPLMDEGIDIAILKLSNSPMMARQFR